MIMLVACTIVMLIMLIPTSGWLRRQTSPYISCQ
jgi:hypothetical protein